MLLVLGLEPLVLLVLVLPALVVLAQQVLRGRLEPLALAALARAGLRGGQGVACLLSSRFQLPQRRMCGITSRNSSLE